MTDAATLAADTITPQQLRFERLLPASVETVWQYLVEPELRARWFMGGAIDPRPGGAIEMVFDHDNLSDGDAPMPEKYAANRGKRWNETIRRIEPPHLLAISWDGGDTGEVVFELEPVGDATRLTLTHSGLRGPADAKNFGGGWLSHLAVLEKRIAGEHVENFWALHAEAEAKAAKAVGV
jgi:uncharacterized protein YndB with AHSA1/START domain